MAVILVDNNVKCIFVNEHAGILEGDELKPAFLQ